MSSFSFGHWVSSTVVTSCSPQPALFSNITHSFFSSIAKPVLQALLEQRPFFNSLWGLWTPFWFMNFISLEQNMREMIQNTGINDLWLKEGNYHWRKGCPALQGEPLTMPLDMYQHLACQTGTLTSTLEFFTTSPVFSCSTVVMSRKLADFIVLFYTEDKFA